MKQLKSRGLFWLCLMVAVMASAPASGQNYSLSVNAAQLLELGTFNIGGGYPVSRHISVNASAAFNPFTYGSGQKQKYFRRVELFAGARYWPWFVNSGWFVSGYADWAKYSYGGIFTKKSYEGYALGLKLGGGYALMVDKGVNLEFGWGAFIGSLSQTEYSCTKCGSKLGKKEKFVVRPSDVLVGLSIVF